MHSAQPLELGSVKEPGWDCNHMDTYTHLKLARLLNQGKHKNDSKVNSSHLNLKQNILLGVPPKVESRDVDSLNGGINLN
jgi:hypothetical protein